MAACWCGSCVQRFLHDFEDGLGPRGDRLAHHLAGDLEGQAEQFLGDLLVELGERAVQLLDQGVQAQASMRTRAVPSS
jgi:hypothetical protein